MLFLISSTLNPQPSNPKPKFPEGSRGHTLIGEEEARPGALPPLNQLTIFKLIFRICGTNPSTLEQERHQID